jgi:ABC-2 type transport system permease protein
MDARRIVAIFWKDFYDAVRDSRVLVALVVPLGLALAYNFILDDEPDVPKATVAVAAAEESQLSAVMRDLAEDSLRLSFNSVTDADAVRQQVEAEDADLGLVLTPGFDAAVARSDVPGITLVLPESPSVGGSVAVALLDPALRQLAGQGQPASIAVDTVPPGESENVINRIGERRYSVLGAAIMTIALIGMFIVPTVLADETEKKTLDALVLIATDVEVVAAKALFGLAYIAVAIPLLFIMTGIRPVEPVPFTLGLVLLSITFVGLGLLLGGMLSAAQLNTWGGIFIIPILLPALVVGEAAPGWLEAILALVPTTQGARLALNGMSEEALFGHVWASIAVMLTWCVALYALLLWRLAHREA